MAVVKVGIGYCTHCGTERYFDDNAVADVLPKWSILRCASCGAYANRTNLAKWMWQVPEPEDIGDEDDDDTDTTDDPIEIRLYVRKTLTLELLRDVEAIADKLGATGEEVVRTTRNGHAYVGVSLERMRQAMEIDHIKSRPAA